MLKPLGGWLTVRPQACALGAAHLIHRLVEMARDVETVQHVQSLPAWAAMTSKWRAHHLKLNGEESKMCRKTLGPIKKTATEYGLLTINCHEETLGCVPLGMIEGSTLADEFSTNLRPSHVEARCRRGSRR